MSEKVAITDVTYTITDEMKEAAQKAFPPVPEFKVAAPQEEKPVVVTRYEAPELPVAIVSR